MRYEDTSGTFSNSAGTPDARDARHYHLVLDSTSLDLDTCADLIVAAARVRIAAIG